MLDFLGLVSLEGDSKNKPRSFRTYLELDNVSTDGEEVK
jgi:hypothetical protein